MEKDPIDIKCPSCNKHIAWSDNFPDRPFCSKRCKLIDLGEWASEGYVISQNTKETSEVDAGDA